MAERRYDVEKLEQEFDPRDFSSQDKGERISGEDAIERATNKNRKLFILGKPGSGKTTFLKHTALRAIEGEIDKIPIFVVLKDLAESNKEIIDFITAQFEMYGFSSPSLYVEDLLKNGKAIVLFDSLDEVGMRSKLLIEQLKKFITQYGKCPILMTCRVASTSYSFIQFDYVEMADFNNIQISHYIQYLRQIRVV